MNKILTTILMALTVATAAPMAEAGILSRKGECGFKVVSYRIQGEAGQSFQYAGKTFTIPMHGTIEIVADKKVQSIRAFEQVIDLNERQPNDFGVVEIDLDAERPAPKIASR